MAAGDQVAEHEEIVRALFFPLWSPTEQRATSAAFSQLDVSVSRTAVLSHEAIVRIFKADLGTRAELAATCSTTVGLVLKACTDNPQAAMAVAVIEDPVSEAEGVTANPAHAEIRAWKLQTPGTRVALTKGIANAIRKAATVQLIAPDSDQDP
jgi:uncharacterized protein YfiM (DUF2279 family)